MQAWDFRQRAEIQQLLRHLAADFAARVGRGVNVDVELPGFESVVLLVGPLPLARGMGVALVLSFMIEDVLLLSQHTHLPVVFWIDEKERVRGAAVRGDAQVKLERGRRYIINPGSVGQPRDRNPLSSFAIVDSERMTAQFFRVPYNIRKTQSAILKAGLPPVLANRLKWGT